MITHPRHDVASDRASWSSMLREHFVALDVAGSPAEGFTGDVTSWSLGHLMLSQVRSGSQAIERTPSLVRADHRAYLQVGLVRAGQALVEQDGRRARLGPGDFVVYETTRPFSWALRAGAGEPSWQLDVLTWPRERIRLAESESEAITATTMTGGSGLSRVVSRMLQDLVAEQPEVEGPRSAALADELGDLLTVLTAEPARATRADASLVVRVERYVDEHLADPDLSPESIARAFAVSVRQLHRLFADRQLTVSRLVRARRLEQCRRDLVSPASAGATVTEIATRWGFSDVGVFGRAFRETYGVSAGSYRLHG